MLNPSWHFQKFSSDQFELVFEDLEYPSSGFLYETGYVSSNLLDILKAEWYLNGCACHFELTDR